MQEGRASNPVDNLVALWISCCWNVTGGRRQGTAAERTRHVLVLNCVFLVTSVAALCRDPVTLFSLVCQRPVSTKALVLQLSLFSLCLEGIKAVLSYHFSGYSLPSFHFHSPILCLRRDVGGGRWDHAPRALQQGGDSGDDLLCVPLFQGEVWPHLSVIPVCWYRYSVWVNIGQQSFMHLFISRQVFAGYQFWFGFFFVASHTASPHPSPAWSVYFLFMWLISGKHHCLLRDTNSGQGVSRMQNCIGIFLKLHCFSIKYPLFKRFVSSGSFK